MIDIPENLVFGGAFILLFVFLYLIWRVQDCKHDIASLRAKLDRSEEHNNAMIKIMDRRLDNFWNAIKRF